MGRPSACNGRASLARMIAMLAIGTLLAACTSGLSQPAANATATAWAPAANGGALPSGWIVFTSPEGRYSVGLPAQPTPTTITSNTQVGAVDNHYVIARSASVAYTVAYGDFPPAYVQSTGPQAILDGAVQGAVTSAQGTLQTATPISSGTIPGQDYILVAGGDTVHARVFLAGSRLYQLIEVGPEASGLPDVDAFFGSFTIQAATSGATSASASLPSVGASASPTPSVAGAPAGWQTVSWLDPAMGLALPGDWTASTLPEPTGPGADPSLPEARAAANGNIATPQGPLNSGFVVFVEPFAGSLPAFADHYTSNLKGPAVGATTVERETIVLPAGEAIRLRSSGSTAGAPWYEVDYLFEIPDGRVLTVTIGPVDTAVDQTAIDAFAAQVVATLTPAR
jgi:hypothetical protein